MGLNITSYYTKQCFDFLLKSLLFFFQGKPDSIDASSPPTRWLSSSSLEAPPGSFFLLLPLVKSYPPFKPSSNLPSYIVLYSLKSTIPSLLFHSRLLFYNWLSIVCLPFSSSTCVHPSPWIQYFRCPRRLPAWTERWFFFKMLKLKLRLDLWNRHKLSSF